jgi:hypothetical protein
MTMQAVTGDGEVWEEPSEDLLYMLLTDLVEDRGGHFDIIRFDPAESTFEVSFDGSQFRVIRKDSDAVASSVATSVELHEIHAACTRWAFKIDAARAEQFRSGWSGFDGSLSWLEVSE